MLFFQCENLHVCLARVSDLSIFSIWAGRWWRASAWRLIYGVSLATRPVTSAEKCWPEPIHDHYTIPSTFYVSWSAIFINQFLKFPFVRLTKKVWNKFIINAPNRGMMALSIWPCKVRQKSSVSPSTNYLTMGWPFLGVAMQLSCTHIHFCLWPKQKGENVRFMLQFFDGFKLRMLAPSNFIFSSWTSRGAGSTFVSYSLWNGTTEQAWGPLRYPNHIRLQRSWTRFCGPIHGF